MLRNSAVVLAALTVLCGGSIAIAQQMPPDQGAFINVVTAAQAAFKSAPNEMAAGGVRVNRRNNVCGVAPTRKAANWVGTIKKIGAANDGRGVLEISVAKGVTIATTNNSFSDKYYKSLIDPGSPVYNAAIAMRVGDRVVFSGSFFPDDANCFKEQSLGLTGSLEAPTYLFHFSSLRQIPVVRPWWVATEQFNGKSGCYVAADAVVGGKIVVAIDYSIVRRTLAVYGEDGAAAAGIRVDDMPRIPLPDCEMGSCIAESAGTQSRLIAQMRGGKVAFVDLEAKGGQKQGPVTVPLDGFADAMDRAAKCTL